MQVRCLKWKITSNKLRKFPILIELVEILLDVHVIHVTIFEIQNKHCNHR